MSKRPAIIRSSLFSALLLGLLVGLFLMAARRASKPDAGDDDGVARHTVEKQPDDVLKYWTTEKMRKAKATNQPHIAHLEPEKQPTQRPQQTNNSQQAE